ncbi:hypothetical protein ACIQNG_05905 [Streptomyces sp. NPDC091377]|uniref:hypothetical protein n=1 Tax=Streptomyces sp. NPDC091377 TaxID=3365995 RepID=UPI0037FE9AC8
MHTATLPYRSHPTSRTSHLAPRTSHLHHALRTRTSDLVRKGTPVMPHSLGPLPRRTTVGGDADAGAADPPAGPRVTYARPGGT